MNSLIPSYCTFISSAEKRRIGSPGVILSVSEGSYAGQRDPSLTLRMTSQADARYPTADYVLSKINTDYDSGLCAALASLIIHI